MSQAKKELLNQIVALMLPSLKGLTEKHAKKMLEVVEKSASTVAKKYNKLIQDQVKEASKAKTKADKVAAKAVEKVSKQKEKLAKKAAASKKVSQLMAKDSPKVVKAPPAKAVVRSRPKPVKK